MNKILGSYLNLFTVASTHISSAVTLMSDLIVNKFLQRTQWFYLKYLELIQNLEVVDCIISNIQYLYTTLRFVSYPNYRGRKFQTVLMFQT